MDKNIIEKIQNRHERRNEILDFIKCAKEKRDECDPMKDKETLETINHKLDMANYRLICELDEMLEEVESQL